MVGSGGVTLVVGSGGAFCICGGGVASKCVSGVCDIDRFMSGGGIWGGETEE